MRPLQPIPLPSVSTHLRLPNLIRSLHHILDDVELVINHSSVPEVVDNAPYVGGTHLGGHILDRLGIAVVP